MVASKDECTYSANGYNALVIIYGLNESTSQWDSLFKLENTYNVSGNLTLGIYSNKIDSTWINYFKSEYTYDAISNRTSYISYYWENDQWVVDFKEEYTYDASGNMTLMNEFDWDLSNSQWLTSGKRTYFYSFHSLIPNIPESQIRIYPNPAREYIVFDLTNISKSAKVELFDLQGKKVLEQKLTENKQVSVSHLTKGLYMYKLNNRGIIYKGKLIIE